MSQLHTLIMLIAAAPIAAQLSPTPNPQTVVGEVAQATQTLGILTVVVLVVLSVLALIVVFFVVAALRLGLPLVNVLQSAGERADRLQSILDRKLEEDDAAEKSSAKLRVLSAETQKQTAAAQERTAHILSDLETKNEASAGRKGAVDAITQYVTEDGDKTRMELQAVAEKVIEAKETAQKAATVEDLNKVLQPVLAKFDELSEEVRAAIRNVDTGRLDPSDGSRVILLDARLVPPEELSAVPKPGE